MSAKRNTTTCTAAVSAVLLLTACSSSNDSGNALDGGETGFFSLGVSDAAVHEAEKVCITFDTIEFKPADDQAFTIDLDPPEKVNLLDYQGANAAPILERAELPAAEYEWVRLGVDASLGSNGGVGDTGGDACDGEASYIVMNMGTVHNLFVPSGDQTGLKLVEGFTLPVNGSVDATADWDLEQSIVAPPGLSPDVILKPTVRLVNNVEVGTLSGQVSNSLAAEAGCAPSVYVFDDGVTPNSIDEDDEDPNDPVTTAMVKPRMNGDGTTTYHYEVGFLLPGSYEAAFTCDSAEFEPVDGKPAAIIAQELTVVDFE